MVLHAAGDHLPRRVAALIRPPDLVAVFLPLCRHGFLAARGGDDQMECHLVENHVSRTCLGGRRHARQLHGDEVTRLVD